MNQRVKTLQRDINRLNGQLKSPDLRPVFRLYDEAGEVVGIKDLEDHPVSIEELGPREVIFEITARMLACLNSGSRYVVQHGGRSSGKSWGTAQYILARAITEPMTVLCTREVQISLRYSIKSLLESFIRKDRNLSAFFEIQRDRLIGSNGSEILFLGCRDHTADALRSIEGVKLCFVEEAQTLTDYSFSILNPTIRIEDSQLFFNLNPIRETDYIYRNFILENDDQATVDQFLLEQNPFAPVTIKKDSEALKKKNYAKWAHVYGGELLSLSDIRIFQDWSVATEEFTLRDLIEEEKKITNVGICGSEAERRERIRKRNSRVDTEIYCAMDWGFRDENAFVICYRSVATKTLYIVDELYKPNQSISELIKDLKVILKKHNLEDWPIKADNSRPDSIKECNRHAGIKMIPCRKTAIVEGIDFLQNWHIRINKNCKNFHREAGLYSWKQDATGQPLPVPEDKNNHLWDALRYALIPWATNMPRPLSKPPRKVSWGRM